MLFRGSLIHVLLTRTKSISKIQQLIFSALGLGCEHDGSVIRKPTSTTIVWYRRISNLWLPEGLAADFTIAMDSVQKLVKLDI